MTRKVFLASLVVEVCMAQSVQVREEKVNGRAAWVLDNGVIRVALLRGGGHIGEVRFTVRAATRREP